MYELIYNNLNSGYQPPGGPYNFDAYDYRGNMVFYRDQCWIPEPYTPEVAQHFGYVSFSDEKWETAYVRYINDYISYCHSRGVKVYITLPCYLSEAVISSDKDIADFDNMLKNFIAPVISSQKELIFDRKYMYDAIAHCNSDGAIHRTEVIYQDLLNIGALSR